MGKPVLIILDFIRLLFSLYNCTFQEGLARLEKRKKWEPKDRKSVLDSLEAFQNEAKTARRGIWQYGDVESDDEDTLPPVAAKKTGGRR